MSAPTLPDVERLRPRIQDLPKVLPEYGEWTMQGRCRGNVVKDARDDDQWHPKRRSETALGKRICNGWESTTPCPVRDTCLAFAIQTGQDQGTWGGMDAWERHELLNPENPDRWRKTKNNLS